jgi:6,7-dimethyl-8-ribityllumazine synthase
MMADKPRVLLVAAPFYEDITEQLVAGAKAHCETAADAKVTVMEVPGAFELPGVIAMAADSGRFDGAVALGCVIRGETTHYDYVCGESARGLMDLIVNRRQAIGYGILTVENEAQALARADRKRGNKGADAANACLSMIKFRKELIR